MVTPVLHIKSSRGEGASARLQEAKWTGAKCRVLVNGDCAGVRVDIRTSQTDASSSLLADKLARETTPDGKVTVFLENDSDIGIDADIVLLNENGQVIDSLSIKLGQ